MKNKTKYFLKRWIWKIFFYILYGSMLKLKPAFMGPLLMYRNYSSTKFLNLFSDPLVTKPLKCSSVLFPWAINFFKSERLFNQNIWVQSITSLDYLVYWWFSTHKLEKAKVPGILWGRRSIICLCACCLYCMLH